MKQFNALKVTGKGLVWIAVFLSIKPISILLQGDMKFYLHPYFLIGLLFLIVGLVLISINKKHLLLTENIVTIESNISESKKLMSIGAVMTIGGFVSAFIIGNIVANIINSEIAECHKSFNGKPSACEINSFVYETIPSISALIISSLVFLGLILFFYAWHKKKFFSKRGVMETEGR